MNEDASNYGQGPSHARATSAGQLAACIQELESRQLLTAFGWDLSQPASKPRAWVDVGSATWTSDKQLIATNLNDTGTDVYRAAGTDMSGRQTFNRRVGTGSVAMPTDGNYDFTVPAASITPSTADINGTEFFLNGDYNHDRAVDFDDFSIYAQNHGGTGKSFAQGDSDGDGDVDAADYALVTSRYNTRLAPAPTYEGEVTVSSLAVQPDGTSPLVVNWAPISDATVQASDPANASKTIAGYTVYRSEDGYNFDQVADVARMTGTSEPAVYGYTDSTPVDGTKYWYRIRPFYAVTQPDGSSGFQHLPTTNKAWAASAMQAPTAVDAAIVGDKIFISWTDRSASENEYVIDMRDGGVWSEVGAVGEDATSFVMDESLVGDSLQFRVRATNSSRMVESVREETNASVIGSISLLAASDSRRFNTLEPIEDYLYDAGPSHANETIIVSDAESSESGALVPASYVLDALGRATVQVNINRIDLQPVRSIVLFPNGDKGLIVSGEEYIGSGGTTCTGITVPTAATAGTGTLTPPAGKPLSGLTIISPKTGYTITSTTTYLTGAVTITVAGPTPRPAAGTVVAIGISGTIGVSPATTINVITTITY